MGERFDMSRPIYAQIVERLKAKILAGVYPPGGHLDSVRDMAAAAGVNPNTMQRALAQLEAEGSSTPSGPRAASSPKIQPFGTAAGRDSPRHDRRISRKNARHRLRPGRGRKAYDGLGNKGE